MTPTVAEFKSLTRQAIEEHAARIRAENGFDNIPIDPIALATKLGIEVETIRFYDPTRVGMLVRLPDRTQIGARARDSVAQICFIVAHELGHYFLHPDGEEFVDGEANLYRHEFREEPGEAIPEDCHAEIQANRFAAALLMPEEQIRSAWEIQKSVKVLARMFGVTQMAMRYRIDQLRLW